MPPDPGNNDNPLVVVGASAGGIGALQQLVARLPADFAAPVVVVVHIGPDAGGALPDIITRTGPLDAAYAKSDEPLRLGRILVAPPDHHVCIVDGRVSLDRSPRVNSHRPSIDVLFRSAAEAHGGATIGVILSGSLDDGTAGAAAIRAASGRVVVQDPADALYDSMPSSALVAGVDVVVPARDLAAALVEMLDGHARSGSRTSVDGRQPEAGDEAWRNDRLGDHQSAELDQRDPERHTCPDCGGVLTLSGNGDDVSYRCRVGHEWSPRSLDHADRVRVENALWYAVRTLEDRAALLTRMAARADEHDQLLSAQHFHGLADDAQREAKVVRELLQHER